MARLAFFLASTFPLLALVSCTTKDPTFCDENTPCTDPSAPFCDLTGATSDKNTCTVAPFDAAPETLTLTIELAGAGTGSVASVDGNFECTESPCTFEVDAGTVATLQATAEAGTSFVTWSGACDGFGDCNLDVSASQTVVASFEPQGSVLWTFKPERSATVGTEVSQIYPSAVATNTKGDIVVAGSAVGTPNFGGAPLVSGDPTFGSLEVFVAQYDSSGAHLWSNAYSGIGFSDDTATSLRVNSKDEVVLVGRFEDALTFDGPGDALDSSIFDSYLARLDSTGAHLSSTGFGGNNGQPPFVTVNENDEVLSGIGFSIFYWFDALGAELRTLEPPPSSSEIKTASVDGFGRAIVTGFLFNLIDFAPGVAGGEFNTQGTGQSYMVKLNWDEGTFHSGHIRRVDRISCVTSDPNGVGSYYVVGSFREMVDLQGAGGAVFNPTGTRDGFVAKYGNSHAHIWSVHLPSTAESVATACALDPRGNLVVGGSYTDDIRLTATGEMHLGPGAFIAKYSASTGELLSEMLGQGEATIPSLASDSVGRISATVQLKGNQTFTIGGETIPAEEAPNLLLMQLAP